MCLSMNELINNIWYIYTIEYYWALRKGNPAIYDNLNETRRHYAKWKESEKDKYYIHIWNPKKPDSGKQRAEWWFPGLNVRENGKMLFKGYKLSLIRLFWDICTANNSVVYNWKKSVSENLSSPE